jgi:hypothetical protein
MSESTKKTETEKPAKKARQLHYVPDYDLTVEASDSIEAGEIAKKQAKAKETNKSKEEQ